MARCSSPTMRALRAATLGQAGGRGAGATVVSAASTHPLEVAMDLRVKAWHLPPRLITGAYFLNAGLSKRGADDATAGQLHGFAAGTYPLLGRLDAKRFTGLLST